VTESDGRAASRPPVASAPDVPDTPDGGTLAAERAVGADGRIVRSVGRVVRSVGWRAALAASAVAVGTVLAVAAVRIALNAGVVGEIGAPLAPVAETAALVGPAAAALVCGIGAPTVRERVGLIAVGVFGLLAAAVPAALVPAIGAVVGGGIVALSARLGRPFRTDRSGRVGRDDRADRSNGRTWTPALAALAVGALLGGAALALAVGVGLLPAGARGPGSVLALCGLAATPVLVHPRPSRRAWVVGALCGAGALLAGTLAPFVAGAVALVAWAAVDVSLPVIAVAVAGLLAAIVAGLHRRDAPTVIGGVLLLGTGVPATLPRGIAAVLALWLLAGGLDRVADGDTAGRATPVAAGRGGTDG